MEKKQTKPLQQQQSTEEKRAFNKMALLAKAIEQVRKEQ